MDMSIVDTEDEYEYDYDDVKTEVGLHDAENLTSISKSTFPCLTLLEQTFFVDIDLSSLNYGFRPINSTLPKRMTPAKRKLDESTTQTPDAVERGGEHTTLTQEPQEAPTPARTAENDQDAAIAFPSRAQILDLNSVNPIVSYQGQVFSCTWTDMVGTNMFFSSPDLTDPDDALRSTEDYNLIGTSRIKLVGHQAKVTKKDTKATDREGDIMNSQSVDSHQNNNSPNDGDHARQQQASFLEKIMEIQRNRGETDPIRAYVDDQIASADQRKVLTSHREEIQALNARVIRGDADALARLQEIYSQPDETVALELTGTPDGVPEPGGVVEETM